MNGFALIFIFLMIINQVYILRHTRVPTKVRKIDHKRCMSCFLEWLSVCRLVVWPMFERMQPKRVRFFVQIGLMLLLLFLFQIIKI